MYNIPIILKSLNCLVVYNKMMSTDSHSSSDIQEILRLKNVAVVGMSNTDGKSANPEDYQRNQNQQRREAMLNRY